MFEALFGGDMTAVPGRCAHCDTVNMVGAMRAYTRAPGPCCAARPATRSSCGSSRPTEATYVDARGAAYLRFERR